MAKAFLSHSSQDKPLVEKIALQLGRNNCHYDGFTFEAGRQTLNEIMAGLQDTDVFVLFISNAALESEWVKKEIRVTKKLYDQKIIDKIFPLIIDKTISYDDDRIPDWIKKPYNIRPFDNEVLILKKIRQFLRESLFKQYSHLKQIDELFVGRNDIMSDFEYQMINIDNTKPTCIIAASYFEGIGRRTFLRNGLIKTRVIPKLYDPIPISISAKESIEDFLYKLNFIDSTPDVFTHDFATEEMPAKIELATQQIKKFTDNGEIVFVLDEGSIVLPNNKIVDWFDKIISNPILQNQVSICLISKFKPYIPSIKKKKYILCFQVDELSDQDTQTLFLQYLNLIGYSLQSEDTRFFLDYLKGIPTQIMYAANLIKSIGHVEAKRYINDIEEFDELRALSILDFLKDDPLCIQMLIALSKFEIVSHDLVYKIFGENAEVYQAIQKLVDLTLFFKVSSTHEYIKLNSSISDYINRAKMELDEKYQKNMKQMARESLSQPLILDEQTDYSNFLFTLQTMIEENKSIPTKFLIPSFLLKSIISEYNKGKYSVVIELAHRLISNENKFDSQIIRETKNWLCLAYARLQDRRFFELIDFFKDPYDDSSLIDYYFLLGFYNRHGHHMDDAEENYLKVLEIYENHSRTKRELVIVYLSQGLYNKAINLAKDNYLRFRTNILHIQAYFTCLIKVADKSEYDMEMINELLDNAEKSHDKKARYIHREMQAEYAYYINNDIDKASDILHEAMDCDSSNFYAFRALFEIYKHAHEGEKVVALLKQYPSLSRQLHLREVTN